MDTGSIVITEDDYGNCTVEVRLVDGNVWMTQYEIARLFGVYEATVRNNLRTVFKSGMLREWDVTHPSCNGQSGFCTLYGLEAIIYMSFRTGTYRLCIRIRRCLMTCINTDQLAFANIACLLC